MSTAIESQEFWQEQLKRLKASGQSRSQYCRANSVDYDRFSYWIKRLSSAPPAFIPVKVQEREVLKNQPILCTVELHGHVLKIHAASALSILLEKLT